MAIPTFSLPVISRAARISADRLLPALAVRTSSPQNILLLELIAGRKGLVGQRDQGKTIVADAGNNMILSGYFNFNVSFGATTLTNLNGSDLYLVKLTP